MDLVRADASFGRLSYPTESWAYNESIDPVLRENRARIQQRFSSNPRRSPLCAAEMDGEVFLSHLRQGSRLRFRRGARLRVPAQMPGLWGLQTLRVRQARRRSDRSR